MAACVLRPDPAQKFCALGAAGATPTVFIDGPPTAKVTAATLNGAALPIGPDGKIVLTALNRGTNPLNMTIEGVQAGDVVTLVEACDNDTRLCAKPIGNAPGNGNPVLNFRIHAD